MNLLMKREEKERLKRKSEERARLREDMKRLEAEIRRNESLFNLVTDENLIDALIFERNANEASMNYLLQHARSICARKFCILSTERTALSTERAQSCTLEHAAEVFLSYCLLKEGKSGAPSLLANSLEHGTFDLRT